MICHRQTDVTRPRRAEAERLSVGGGEWECPAEVLALGGVDVLAWPAVALFVFFLIVVAAGMAGVGIQNLRQSAREFREKSGEPTELMDILNRGIGKK